MNVVIGALIFTFVCFVRCSLSEKTDGDPNSKAVILGISAVCYDPKDVCNFQPCQNGARCSPPDDDAQPYKCHCLLGFGGLNCENKLVSLEVVKTEPREVQLSIRKSDNAHWAGYITELVNLRTSMPLENRWIAQPGRVTELTLPRLEPGSPYSVRVRPVKDFREPQVWIDGATVETPVELKIDETRTVLSVVTSNSTEWSYYAVKRTNQRDKTTVTFRQDVQPGNVTKINLAPLDLDTEYHVRVIPVQDGKELEQWANEIHFRISNYDLHFPKIGTTDYVSVEGMPDLEAITACIWMRSTHQLSGTKLIPLFSYVISGTHNEFLFYMYWMAVKVECYAEDEGVYHQVNELVSDGHWHHLCFTWSSEGWLKIYKDGEQLGVIPGYRKGKKIAGGGLLVLGQDQDEVGGRFDPNQSFVGDVSGANVWDRVLTEREISDLSESCLAGEGNVFQWFDFRNRTHGDVEVNASSECEA